MNKKILIGSNNIGKINEIKEFVEKLNKGFNVLSLNDLNLKEEVEETGATFFENAVLKSKFYFEKTGIPTISDDGGLIIPYLNNEPGVKSRRWLGYPASDEELINYTLDRMKKAKGKERTAFLETCLCYYDGINLICEQEKIKGIIAEKPSENRIKGYPFRSLFIVESFNKYYDELTQKEHEIINHRIKALKRLFDEIIKL
jgi:XTP/dITP diphosphohydrolase